MGSVVVDGFTIAGVVANVLSLAAAIWALKIQRDQAAASQHQPRKEFRVRRVHHSEVHILPTGEFKSVVTALEEITQTEE
jgi:hypothetical protein